MDSKELIKETLDFYKYKLDHGCTMEDIEIAARWAAENIGALGTVEDFAKFFGKKESDVRTVINRKVIDKPKRRVFYHFIPFLKNVPPKWLEKK